MNDFFLDLKDKPRVVDFLVDASAFADADARQAAEVWVKAHQEGEHVGTDKLAEAARTLALATWPARYAVWMLCEKEDPEEEWRRVTSAVRPSTAHLLKRVRTSNKTKTLSATLADPDASTALRDEEQAEINEVRTQIRHDLWKEKASTLDVLVQAGTKELAGYRKRFERLRELALALPSSLQEEVFSKIARYEDRILFAGDILPLEILDQEIAYYNEQKEISPLEE
jgi:hypothetical protein